MDIELLAERARIIRAVRAFFDERGYLELDTPLLSPALIPESCLEVFETERLYPQGKSLCSSPYYLIPSPEIWMKKLIAAHKVNCYQVCKSFRNGESTGRLHSPEFTMLEYYTMDADYRDSLALTEALLEHLVAASTLHNESLRAPFVQISIEEAFERWAGIKLFDTLKEHSLLAAARRLGLDPCETLDDATLYDLIFIDKIEPKLPKDRPVVLIDYPTFSPCLAKKSPDRRTYERWEVYVHGIELANCFSEETDPLETRNFIRQEAAAKERAALIPHKTAETYWEQLPRCSGVALGLDRVIMALTGRTTIDSILPFPMDAQCRY
ncbi:EF-P lysine aminoacylase GenX [Breznakiellaceae bacterium SP9]